MAENKDVTKQKSKPAQGAAQTEAAMWPAVDIFEDDTGITVQADMPGVSRDGLDVHIDADSLSIVGKLDIPMPATMEALHADVRATRYQRSFSLSRELDRDKIEANLRDGVLTLRIPKREEVKPRKIEVRAS
ncbi:MAG: heat-shock protein [Gammaproteobacteria bacterium SG8_47]|nr:MAG: heat-shock protein [Gammaproteobacteria bacterium SG8_47]